MLHSLDIDAVLRMSAEQFDEWRILFNQEPWGEERAEWLNALSIMHCTQSGSPRDYMPFCAPPKAEMDPKQMMTIVSAMPGAVFTPFKKNA